MANMYIRIEETNQRINEFSILYMMNPNLSINKAFKDQVKICLKNTSGIMTQQHISKILLKPNTRVLSLSNFLIRCLNTILIKDSLFLIVTKKN